jgi:hypothetical protein
MKCVVVRIVVVVAVLLAQRGVGSWLVGIDPLAELLTGTHRLGVGAAVLVLVPLRFAAWFVVLPWAVAGTLADLTLWQRSRARTTDTHDDRDGGAARPRAGVA